MRISQNFTLDEFTFSRTAIKFGIDNTPAEDTIENIISLTKNVLQPLRSNLSRPIHITSGYRSPQLNRAVGGVSDSQHLLGEAVDFIVGGYSIDEVFNIISMEFQFDQLINEFQKWIHLSYTDNNRKERFKAYVKDGQTIYLPI